LAHSRSALKRWRQSLERRDRNRSTKSRTRTLLTRALNAIDADPASAEAAVREAVSALDRAAQKGVIHANAAARGKSRLLKRFNLATANAVAAAAASPAAPAAEAEDAPETPARRRGILPRRSTEQPADETPPARRARTPRATGDAPNEQPPARRTRTPRSSS
jgi:small subunit ribosomal protein S20